MTYSNRKNFNIGILDDILNFIQFIVLYYIIVFFYSGLRTFSYRVKKKSFHSPIFSR